MSWRSWPLCTRMHTKRRSFKGNRTWTVGKRAGLANFDRFITATAAAAFKAAEGPLYQGRREKYEMYPSGAEQEADVKFLVTQCGPRWNMRIRTLENQRARSRQTRNRLAREAVEVEEPASGAEAVKTEEPASGAETVKAEELADEAEAVKAEEPAAEAENVKNRGNWLRSSDYAGRAPAK